MYPSSRRHFLKSAGLGAAFLGFHQGVLAKSLSQEQAHLQSEQLWVPASDRKIKVGLVGYGYCKFAAQFGFQDHPNVEIAAVSDLIPDRCAELAKVTGCSKTYPSLEEMVKDDRIEAIFIATDAPSHARHAILSLKHGKHVAVTVPAIFGSLEEADELFEAVKKSGKKYMMYETSCYRKDLYDMYQIYQLDGFGTIVYSEGEYLHYGSEGLPSYLGWRDGMPPMFYLTHATAYYVGVTGGSFTTVSCAGVPSHLAYLKEGKNRYNNKFGTQVAMLTTDQGGLSRMMYSKDTQGAFAEEGRVRGEKGSYDRFKGYEGTLKDLTSLKRPALPAGVKGGGHGGSHGQLTEEFVRSILEDRKPWIDIAMSLNMSIPGIVAHESCLKNGETLKIPQYKMW